MFTLRRRAAGVRQHDLTDCGAACLDSVARYYGRRLPISRIRQYAGTDRKGTNVLGMLQAAARLGFTAKGVKGPFESLPHVPLPAIAHLVVDRVLQHFVVVYALTRRHVRVMDPADGRMHRLTHAEFQERWTGVLILLVPGEEFRPARETTSSIRRLCALVRPHSAVMAQALVGAAAYTILGLATAIYVQKIVDHVIVDGNRNLLNLMSVAMIALVAAQVYMGHVKGLLVLRTGQRIDAALILGYYRHLLRLPQRFFDTMRVGEVLSRVNDAVKIRAFINNVVLDLAVNLLVVAFAFGLMLLYSWRLALVMAAAVPLYAMVLLVVNRVNRRNQRQLMESAAELESQLVESLSAVTTLKRFGLEAFAGLRTETRLVRLLRPVHRAGTSALSAGSATELISRISTVALLWTGAGFVLQQSLSPGELMSFYALVGYLTAPITGLVTANQTVQDALIAADRLFEIMDLEREEQDGGMELTPALVGDVEFRGVSFRYGSRTLVFDGLELTIPRGRMTAVVGESGSGKSTLMALLQRLYPLDAGRVTIGGYDLRHLSHESLRRVIGVVPQQVDLFAGTVLENIALGEFEPDMRRVLEVCGRLGITDFIEALPQGFHSHLGEHGATLSGGQRQRLAIARALYRQPQLLVLDEATSSLDSLSERFVQRTLQDLRRAGTTIVLIAHRLSTVVAADRIVVLEGGRVVEEGTHRELMRRDGKYCGLWRCQLSGEGMRREETAGKVALPAIAPQAGADTPGAPAAAGIPE